MDRSHRQAPMRTLVMTGGTSGFGRLALSQLRHPVAGLSSAPAVHALTGPHRRAQKVDFSTWGYAASLSSPPKRS